MQFSKPFLLLLAIFILASCNTAKKVSVGKIDRNSPDFLMKTLVTNQVNVQWLEAVSYTHLDVYKRQGY